jgi:glyoxylase-like metal-dependent hydrolase (beta-lactamase superfamily II)
MSKPFKVFEDVWMVGSGALSDPEDACAYLLDGGTELALIDSGAGRSFSRIDANIRDGGFDPRKLKYLVATHAHIDHVGSLAAFREEYALKVVAHKLDVMGIESGRGIGAEFYGVDYRPCPVDLAVEDGRELVVGRHRLKLVHIPGHTPGSLAAVVDLKGKRVLFGQDIHGPYMSEWGADPVKARQSLQKLIDLKADILCEGHFGVEQPADAVRAFIAGYLEGLK